MRTLSHLPFKRTVILIVVLLFVMLAGATGVWAQPTDLTLSELQRFDIDQTGRDGFELTLAFSRGDFDFTAHVLYFAPVWLDDFDLIFELSSGGPLRLSGVGWSTETARGDLIISYRQDDRIETDAPRERWRNELWVSFTEQTARQWIADGSVVITIRGQDAIPEIALGEAFLSAVADALILAERVREERPFPQSIVERYTIIEPTAQ